jgi:hypothetical protein
MILQSTLRLQNRNQQIFLNIITYTKGKKNPDIYIHIHMFKYDCDYKCWSHKHFEGFSRYRRYSASPINCTEMCSRARIAQWYSAGLRVGWLGVRFPAGAGNFFLHHRVQTGSGAHPASYPMGTRGSFPGGKNDGAWSWPLTSIQCRDHRMRGANHHSPIRLHGVVLS